MLRATELAHLFLRQAVKPGALVVDATVGNGYDTLFLAELVEASGHVFGFDIQEAALERAAVRLAGWHQVTFFSCGHEYLAERLPPKAKGQIDAVMFNLGYLPGGSKHIMTRAETTLSALTQALEFLAVGGLITVVLYPGHHGGAEETVAIKEYAAQLPAAFAAVNSVRLNARQPAPELVVISRRQQ